MHIAQAPVVVGLLTIEVPLCQALSRVSLLTVLRFSRLHKGYAKCRLLGTTDIHQLYINISYTSVYQYTTDIHQLCRQRGRGMSRVEQGSRALSSVGQEGGMTSEVGQGRWETGPQTNSLRRHMILSPATSWSRKASIWSS